MNNKTYSGIIGQHKGSIDSLLLEERAKGSSYAKIAKLIGSNFGLKVSHSTVCSYWKNELNGVIVDGQKKVIEGEVLKSIDDGLAAPLVDRDELGRINDKHQKKGTLRSVEHLRDIAELLVYSNQMAHLEGLEVLRPQYTKMLRDLEGVIRSRKG